MTFQALQAEVSRRLAEVSSGRIVWSLDEIKQAINDGYAEISDAVEWNEQWEDLDLLADRPYYDLRAILGEAFLALRPAFDRQTNRWLIPSTVEELDQHDRRWERVTGEPQRLVLRGLWWLGLYPRIQSEIGQIKQGFVALPDPLEEDEDEPGIPDTFQYALVDFALTDLWAQDGEVSLALAAWAAYLKNEDEFREWLDGRAGGPMRRGFFGSAGTVTG